MMKRDKRSERVYLPTSHEIRRECERIQDGWSDRERQKRAGHADGRHWLPPVVDSQTLLPDQFGQTMDPQVG